MRQYVVDAFAERPFEGNPAAVCVMRDWIPEGLMAAIAAENNLSETAFAVKRDGLYRLRWFAPGGEVDLCGHATLACAFVIMEFVERGISRVEFATRGGILPVLKSGDLYELDFPAYSLAPAEVTPAIIDALGAEPAEAFLGRDLLCVFDGEPAVRGLRPDPEKVKRLDGLLLHATSKGRDCDCVSRSFAPKLGVPEDPVCGSGHCHIAPYWASKLAKDNILAYQASARGGTLHCRMENGRVKLGGGAVLYSVADIMPQS